MQALKVQDACNMEICQLYTTAAKTTSKEQESFSCKQISIFRGTNHLYVNHHFKNILSTTAWFGNNIRQHSNFVPGICFKMQTNTAN